MRIVVIGAGSIGCYVGGRLLAGGADVVLVARGRVRDMVSQEGLHLSDLYGYKASLTPEQVPLGTVADVVRAKVVLVTVKSAATADVALSLDGLLAPDCVVISLQNGLNNAKLLAEAFPDNVVLAGMVPFNVVQSAGGHFHQGSEGDLMVKQHEDLIRALPAFAAAGLPLQLQPDMVAVQWSKLLLNLNNVVNALSGIPLQAQLAQRGYRRVLAAAQREALILLQQRGQALIKLTALPPTWLPTLLTVPDWLFKRAAKRMLDMDPLARSSMWEDLEAGRETEIRYINGEVVGLARGIGGGAPVNTLLIELIRDAESGGRRDWAADELWQVVQARQKWHSEATKRAGT